MVRHAVAQRGYRHPTISLLAIFAACSAPDAKDLFVPLPLEGAGSGGGGGGGAGREQTDAAVLGAGGSGAREGQGGAIGVAGGEGDGGSGSVSAVFEDAGLVDAGVSDAALGTIDASPEPPACVPGVELCDGLDNDCDDLSDEGSTCVAECDGFTIAGRGYMFCSPLVSRAEAIGRCELEAMHLVWIETEAEQAALIENIAAANVPRPNGNPELLVQIGASDAVNEGVWRWVGTDLIADSFQFWQGAMASSGGAPVAAAFANWDDVEPNDGNGEDCALISVLGSAGREVGAWDDRGCNVPFAFVCEAE